MIQLNVSGPRLICRHPIQAECWSIAVCDIVLIAEFTTDEGAQKDDYFLVFVTREGNELYYSNVTMYAAGIDESLTQLESCMNCSLDLTLHSSKGWNSRVVWPPAIAGSPYFRYEQVVPEGFWARLQSRMKPRRVDCHVADPICEYLAAQIPPQANEAC